MQGYAAPHNSKIGVQWFFLFHDTVTAYTIVLWSLCAAST
uniref:Uncharacterized protein n=1 Tax=Triticum urartu TaxID=4572 RepID=A0A8R7P3W5_TRIUA